MKTCLIVDDAPLDRELLKRAASGLGFNVIEAASGDQALKICHSAIPDCILMDWEMPGIKGIAVLEEIRGMEQGKDVCVLICTSNTHPAFVGRAYIKGASDYLTKPVTSFDLESKLREVGGL